MPGDSVVLGCGEHQVAEVGEVLGPDGGPRVSQRKQGAGRGHGGILGEKLMGEGWGLGSWSP